VRVVEDVTSACRGKNDRTFKVNCGRVRCTVLHNRYLPGWAHRLANGLLGGFQALIALVAVVPLVGAPLGVLWLALPMAVCCMALDPGRFSLVEGCAGDLGYDELLDDAGKPEDGACGEA
jgi:hypothetical protein